MSKHFIALGLAGLAFALSASAPAATMPIDLDSTFGPLHLDVDMTSGQVHGTYPKFGGEIFGQMKAGDVDGIWTQPKSEHPCKEERHGTVNWGRLVFPAGQESGFHGSWGYCDADPTQPWDGKLVK